MLPPVLTVWVSLNAAGSEAAPKVTAARLICRPAGPESKASWPCSTPPNVRCTCVAPLLGHCTSMEDGSGCPAGFARGSGSFISNPARLALMRKLRSRAGSGAMRSTPCQSVAPLMGVLAGSDRAERMASPLMVPLNTSCVRVTGWLRGDRACI